MYFINAAKTNPTLHRATRTSNGQGTTSKSHRATNNLTIGSKHGRPPSRMDHHKNASQVYSDHRRPTKRHSYKSHHSSNQQQQLSPIVEESSEKLSEKTLMEYVNRFRTSYNWIGASMRRHSFWTIDCLHINAKRIIHQVTKGALMFWLISIKLKTVCSSLPLDYIMKMN